MSEDRLEENMAHCQALVEVRVRLREKQTFVQTLALARQGLVQASHILQSRGLSQDDILSHYTGVIQGRIPCLRYLVGHCDMRGAFLRMTPARVIEV